MRRLFFLLVPLACASGVPTDPVPCEHYEHMSGSEASREIESLAAKAEELGPQLAAFQRDGIPDEDPRSTAVAVPLGETLGRMYALCICNEELALTDDCQSWRPIFEESFGP